MATIDPITKLGAGPVGGFYVEGPPSECFYFLWVESDVSRF